MTIQNVKKKKNSSYIVLELSGAEKPLMIRRELYAELGEPSVGYELSPYEYSQIVLDDEYYRATVKALNILSFGDNSKRKLYEKLRRTGFTRDICERVVSDMTSLGYIDEQRQLLRLVESLANVSLLGPHKITQKLMGRGYSPGDIKSAVLALTLTNEVDFEGNFVRLTERLFTADATDEDIIKIKYKYGYQR